MSAFDFVIKASVQGDVAAIARLERLQGALRMIAASAARGSVREEAAQNALARANRALATARGNTLASGQMATSGLGPAAPGPFQVPPRMVGGPPPLAGGGMGGAIGRLFAGGGGGAGGGAFGRVASGAMSGLFGGGLPMHVKAFFNMLMGARAIQGVASLSKAAGHIAAVSGTFEELNGGAVEAAKRMRELKKGTEGILSESLIQQGVSAIQVSGAKSATGGEIDTATFSKLLKGVVQLGRVPGFSATESVDKLRNAISTGSTAGLDKILPGFDADLAVRNFMEESGMSKDEVDNTPGLVQTILVDAIQKAVDQNLARTPQSALKGGNSFDQLAAAAEDAKNKLVSTVGGSREFQGAVDAMTRVLENATPRISDFATSTIGALATEEGAWLGAGVGAAGMGGRVGMMLGGPWGAAYGATLGAGMTAAAGFGSYGADAAADVLARSSGEAAYGQRFAEPDGFDQARYDREQAEFVRKLTLMDNESEGDGPDGLVQSKAYQAYKASAAGQATAEKNAAEATDLLAPASVRAADALRGLAGNLTNLNNILAALPIFGATAASINRNGR